jgi:hypothetical protein
MDAAAAAAMSDPLRNPHFRRRWREESVRADAPPAPPPSSPDARLAELARLLRAERQRRRRLGQEGGA